ncbi:MAG: putative quinol monooxygenase [Gammaproteobacteria bacterium]
MQLALFVRTRTKPGQRELVRRAWEELMKPGIDGNTQQPVYFFCEDKDDDDVFCLFEIYQTQSSFEKAAESRRFADYMARIGHLLDGPPVVNLTTPVWGKGLSDQDMQQID